MSVPPFPGRFKGLIPQAPVQGLGMRPSRPGPLACRKYVATLMRRMGIEAIYRRPNTSKPAPGHKIYPYLLRSVSIGRPNQVWAMDITYIPMARGFVYLAAVVDWFSRRVLAWRLSITLEVEFCLEAVEEALVRHGRPAISTPTRELACNLLGSPYRWGGGFPV